MNGFDPYAPPGHASGRGAVDTSPYAPPYERADQAAGQPFAPYLPPTPMPYGGDAPWSGPSLYPPSAEVPAKPRTHPAAVAGLALGCAAIAVLGVATGLVSAGVGLAGLVTSALALVLTRGPRGGARGTAVAGLTTSVIAVVVAGVVFLVSWTGVGAGLQAWLGGEVDLPIVALRPGEAGTVGDYTVTVEEIRMAADAALLADPDNPPADGTYVEAVVTVTYAGRGVGNVDDDLLVSYVGSDDAWMYDEWGCMAATESPVWDVPRMAPGDTATFVSCMDVPADVVDEAAVIVEDLGAPTFSAEMWGRR